jgi:1-aminocyclopropane-1-carboxylate deaminase
MQSIAFDSISVDQFSLQSAQEQNISLHMLRLDRMHEDISGNKWFKLQYYLEDAASLGKKGLVTWGGAWSNHILATAAAAKLAGFRSSGIIRGEKPDPLNPLLKKATDYGMDLYFVNREKFQMQFRPAALDTDENYFIQSGGAGEQGVRGASTIPDYCKKEDYSDFICAAGTGTMMAGIIRTISSSQKLTGISVMKNNSSLEREISQAAGRNDINWQLEHSYHFGGYAKYNYDLISFMNEFYKRNSIPTDFVYTGKLCYAINDLIEKKYFTKGSRILAIHSGGLVGNKSLEKGTLIF